MESRIKLWMQEIKNNKKIIIISFFFLMLAISFNSVVGNYVDKTASISVPDMILDNIPVINLQFLFVYGSLLMAIALLFYPLFFNVSKFHVVLSQSSFLIFIRSLFVMLTHLKIPTNAVIISVPKFYELINYNNDLFFSGHVATAFLGFLIFRKQKIGLFFLISTIVMGATVLLMHLHYSIDVFAALFITYGSFKIGEWFFKKI